MQSLGIDLGSSSVKLVLLENGSVTASSPIFTGKHRSLP